MPRRMRLAVASLLALAAGCSVLQTQTYQGTCAATYRECARACDDIADVVKGWGCEARCSEDARVCSRRQKDETGLEVERLDGESAPIERHAIVSLVGEYIAAGDAEVSVSGPVEPVGDAHGIGPGGLVRMRIPLAATPAHGELVLLHGSAASGTFVTITLAGRTLVGRYAPPPRRDDGQLRVERWDLAPLVELMRGKATQSGGAPDDVELVFYNNKEGGSVGTYLLGAVQIIYREAR